MGSSMMNVGRQWGSSCIARNTLPLRNPNIVPVVAKSLSKGFRCPLLNKFTILQPDDSIGKSLNILSTPPPMLPEDFFGCLESMDLPVCRNIESTAELSILKKGLDRIGIAFTCLSFLGVVMNMCGLDEYKGWACEYKLYIERYITSWVGKGGRGV